MYEQGERERATSRRRALALLGVSLTLAVLAMVFVNLSASQAAPSETHVASQPGCCAVQEGTVLAGDLDATSAEPFLIATSPDYWPMEYISGTQIVGHDIDLMNAIAAEMGVTAVYTNVAFGELIPGLVAAEYDAVISSLTVTPDREELIDFTLPYVTLGDSEELAIAVQPGDEALRQQINGALRQLRADGVLQAIIAAIEEDQPEWQPRLPDWTSEIHVCTAGPPTCDYGSVQDAVDAAAAGDVIKVAAGTYAGVYPRPRQDVTTTGTVVQVVYISKTVTIQGGYTPSDWTVADPEANPTTLDAQGLGRVIYITGDISPTIEGLRITGGEAQGLGGISWGADTGGGLYVITATAVIHNNEIVNNSCSGFLPLGGGMTLYASNATVSGNRFRDNTADFVGGGVYLAWSGAALSDNLFTANSAQWGGGAFVTGSGAAFIGNVVTSNTAEIGGGLVSEAGSQWFINNVIADNQASQSGGGFWSNGSSPRLYHNTIARNSAGDGSGVYVTQAEWAGLQSTVALTNTILVDHGVGISVTGGNTVTVNGILWHNTPVIISQSPTATVAVQNEHTGDPAFEADGYHLRPQSAAIDRGVVVDVPLDIDGEARPQGAGYDLGADEDGVVADVALTLSDDPDPVVVGGAMTYTIGVSNHGPAEATGVVLTDTLPGNATFVWASAGCTEESGTVVCDAGSLAAGEGVPFTIGVTADAVGQLINLAEVAAQELDPDVANDLQVEYTAVATALIQDPTVAGLTPDSGFNDEATLVTIYGSNFQQGAVAYLDGNLLEAITFVDDHTLQAATPAGLTPSTYDLEVVNPDDATGVLLGAFTVVAPTPPNITELTPAQGPNDTPITIHVYGANFAPEVTATLATTGAQVSLETLSFLDTTHLRAYVPVSITPASYTLVLTNPDGRSATLPDAYHALAPAVSDDLYAGESGFWLDPAAVHKDEPVTIGLTLRRQGGQDDLEDVKVRFTVEETGDVFTATAPLLPSRGAITVTAEWTPAAEGEVILQALIDPGNQVSENNEENNLVSRQATVLPPLRDTTPPVVTHFAINGGAIYLECWGYHTIWSWNCQAYLDTQASDNAGGSGVANLLFVESEWDLGVGDWVPVASSGWLPYDSARSRYPWRFQISTYAESVYYAGVRYIQVWAADADGNVSLEPAAQMINVRPRGVAGLLRPYDVDVYRHPLAAGESLRIRGGVCSCAPYGHVYVWAPDGERLAYLTIPSRQLAEATATAPMDGVYQIEVDWANVGSHALYNLYIVPLESSQSRSRQSQRFTGEGRMEPVVPPSYAPGRWVGLPSAPVSAKRFVYLPLVVRGDGP